MIEVLAGELHFKVENAFLQLILDDVLHEQRKALRIGVRVPLS